MKLSAILILIACLQVQARGYGQRITISEQNVPLPKLFMSIYQQTGYQFIYNDETLQGTRKVSLSVKEATLREVLDICFKDQPLDYVISDGAIIVRSRILPIHRPDDTTHLPLSSKVPVTGTVRNADTKTTLENVSVTIQGSRKGVVTDGKGKFTLNAAVGTTIIFSSVGFQTVRYVVKTGDEPIEITLTASSNSLNDVVVVGVQTQSKRKTTSAISTVSGKDIENLPAPSVDQLLQGRVAGLNVQVGSGEPGVAPTIVVRGNTRVNTNIGDANVAQAHALSGPLYVIDGVPVNPEDISNAIDATGTNYLAGINVNDIETIDVQKDAAAAAAWGSRGANGVIYIKTRRGRSATPEFRVNSYGGVILKPQLLYTATGAEERAQKMTIINQYASPSQLSNLPQLLTDSMNPYYNNATDWQDLFYRTGAIENVDATMSAANENVNYRVSMNYYNEKGIIEAFGFTRYSLRGNFDFKISPKANSQLIVALSKSDRQRGRKFYNNSDDNTPVSGAAQPTSFLRLTAFDSANFTGLYSKLRNKNVNDLYSVSLSLNYAVLPALKYSFLGSANVSTSNRDYFQPSNIDQVLATSGSTSQPSKAESDKGSYSTYFISNALNWVKKLSTPNDHMHTIVITGSQQFNADIANSNVVGGTNIPSNDIQVVSGVPQANLYGSSSYAADALLSFTGQAQYDFDSKYLLYASYRGDASSRFGSSSKWGYFPAVGAGWVISDEKFMKGIPAINFLKIRGSYGISGSQSPDFYAPYNSYTIPGTYNGSSVIQPSYTNGLTKDNLTWAKTTQKNIGLETQLFNSRLSVVVDIYDKISRDDYYDFQLPFYTGFQSLNFNAHDLWVSNRGADITIGTHNLSAKSPLQWNMQLTVTYNKNAIAKLPNNNRTFEIDDAYGVGRIFSVGQPIYEMFQLKYKGVYNNAAEIPFNPITGSPITYFKTSHKVVPGDPIWQDVNKIGDVWTDEDNGAAYGDRVPTGNPNPKFTGGWVNDFTYKHFSLSIVSVFTWKRDVINTFFQQQIGNIVGGYSSSITTFANSRLPDLRGVNYWTPQRAASKSGYKADFPSINPFGASYYQFIPISSMFNEDGSYFKVKNVVLGYQLPDNIIKKAKISRARVYCILDNVLTLKKGTMPDPESVDQLGQYTGGLYPLPIKCTLGLDIQF